MLDQPPASSSEASTLVYDSSERRAPLWDAGRDLWRYRDLLRQLIARNIKTRYKRSVLGILWTLLNPLLMMIVLTLVFSNVFRFNVVNYPVYAFCGLILWNFFAQTTTGAMSELMWGGSLMNRIYLPRAIFAVTALGTGLVNLMLSLIPLLLLMLVYGAPIRATILFLPIPILLTALFALGVALFLSTLSVYFSDVVEMYQIVLTAWMYLTPIIYPKEALPANYHWLLNFNPFYHLLEVFRAPLHGGALAGPKTLGAAALTAVASFLIGWWFFASKADEFAYRA
jgi:ABC-type polysaccharide/polyol phosphate export permease